MQEQEVRDVLDLQALLARSGDGYSPNLIIALIDWKNKANDASSANAQWLADGGAPGMVDTGTTAKLADVPKPKRGKPVEKPEPSPDPSEDEPF